MAKLSFTSDEYYPWFTLVSNNSNYKDIDEVEIDDDLWLEYKQALDIVERMQAHLRENFW